ncbi:hypothetical protein GZL_01451 [Streptomyces sp. 769]|nr:hypothetical protein GZL_01451 [Streptomyces sp. 769]
MARMSNTTSPAGGPLPRQVADAYVDALVELDPITGTYLGVAESSGKLPDFSPEGQEAVARLARTTLDRLAEAEARPGADSAAEKVCARLLRERLTAELAVHDAGEGLRQVSNLSSPPHHVREALTLTPADTESDWAAIAQRLRAVPASLAGYRAALQAGLDKHLPAGPLQVTTVIGQLGEWIGTDRSWFADFTAPGPESLRTELDAAAEVATGALVELRDWFRDVYAPAIEGASDVVGCERYARLARYYNGADTDPEEAYAYGWSEFHRLLAEMETEAEKVLPGAKTPWEALAWCDEHGEAVEGVEETRQWLQSLMDEAIDALDGTHFELAERVRRVESRIAPAGSAAAPYYTQPSLDFSRPGRTWPAHPRPLPLPRAQPGVDLVPRGSARPPSPSGTVDPRRRGPAHPLPSLNRRRQRQRRGLGAVRRAPDGRAGLPDHAGAAAGLPGRADDAGDPGHHRHRDAPGAGDPGRLPVPPRRALDAAAGARVPAPRTAAARPTSSRARSSATRAWPARRSATSSASASGSRAGRPPGPGTARTST